jgi:hypothetical protein
MTILMNKTLLSTTGDMRAAERLILDVARARSIWVQDGSPQSGGAA